jgi:hypothetical protein
LWEKVDRPKAETGEGLGRLQKLMAR